jgi:hypothetical protein
MVTTFGQWLHSTLLNDPKIKLECHSILPYIKPVCEQSPQIVVSHTFHKMITIQIRVREGVEYTHTITTQQQHAQMQKRERNNKATE